MSYPHTTFFCFLFLSLKISFEHFLSRVYIQKSDIHGDTVVIIIKLRMLNYVNLENCTPIVKKLL
jgi:hypothetical protein